MDQKDNLHLHIQSTIDLTVLDKAIPSQSFHGGSIIHASFHSNIFELVQNYILLAILRRRKSQVVCNLQDTLEIQLH